MFKLKVILIVTIITNIFAILFVINLSKKTNERTSQVYLENVRCKREVDSIKQEIFVWDIQLSRYEYMLGIVEQENPELYKKIIHETE
jgi:hypothetical protein